MSVECRGVGMSAWLVWGLLVLGGISSLQADNGEDLDWWQNAVVYQIYPRSFKDSNGDGVGDLNGINQMVGYLKDLGVSAVWLSPIYPSPGKDFGYDISDYRNIDPIFGTLDDFKNLAENLTKSNIKLIMDFVPNHSSNEHDWFKESAKNKTGRYADYYVWRDPLDPKKPANSPPNNWVSNFDGSAWTYNEQRQQYYLHQFLKEQPDLNYNNKAVLNEMIDNLKFWSDLNVHGFRMDAVSCIWEDINFQNEPVTHCSNSSKYGCLDHIYTSEQLNTYNILKEFNKTLVNMSGDGVNRIMMTESYTMNFTIISKYYQVASFPFNFILINNMTMNSAAEDWANVINSWYQNTDPRDWPNWVVGNHDQHRVGNRLGKELVDAVNMVILLLKGTTITYNGEEIGMLDSFVRWDQTKDPRGISTGDPSMSRDPQRGPLLWNDTANAGFTNASHPWLPVHSSYWHNNVMMQQENNRSHLNVYKRMVKLRQTYLWKHGNVQVNTIKGKEILAVYRWAPDNPTIMVVVNLGLKQEDVNLLESRPTLPAQLYVYALSENMADYQFGEQLNSTNIVVPPKAAIAMISQPLDIPLKINSTDTVQPSSFI